MQPAVSHSPQSHNLILFASLRSLLAQPSCIYCITKTKPRSSNATLFLEIIKPTSFDCDSVDKGTKENKLPNFYKPWFLVNLKMRTICEEVNASETF